MLLASECLCKAVGCHLGGRDVLNPDDFVLNGFSNEMVTNVNVFRSSMGDRIFGKRNGALIVREKIGRYIVCRFVVV